MKRRDCLLGLATLPLLGGRARAQSYPDRPVSLASGYPAGGSTDIAARLVADGMMRNMAGARIVIENRAGASGTVAAEWLKRQPADGYTLLLSESSSFSIWPAMHEGTKYDPLKDFDWIATVCTTPLVFLASPAFPAKDLKEALALLGTPKSAELDYSSSGAGSIPHIGTEVLRQMTGSNLSRHVPYRGGAAGVLSISKGETAWGMASLGSAAGLLGGNAVRALAVTGDKRFPSFPDVPTFAEAGLPQMDLQVFYLMHGPAGLPKLVVAKLNESTVEALKDATLRERFIAAGMAAWEGPNSPEATRAIVERELARYRDISAKTGIKILG